MSKTNHFSGVELLTFRLVTPAALAVLLAQWCFSPVYSAQDDIPQAKNVNLTIVDYVVGEIRIEGNKLISTDEILAVMKTHAGDRFSREEIIEDLKAINNLGYFDERKLEVNPELVDGQARLTIKVVENGVVKSFSVRGNTVVPSTELLEPFAEQVGKPQNANKLSEAISKVEQKYHDRGYVLAKVKDVVDSPDGNVGLVVEEGIIDQVEVSGEPKSLRDELSKADWLIFAGTKIYNEKRLTLYFKEIYKKGQLHDIRRSLVPLPGLPGKYVLKIVLTPVLKKKAIDAKVRNSVATCTGLRGSVFAGIKPESLRHTQLLINREDYPIAVWVEELFEDPRYGLELVRRKCSPEEAFVKTMAFASDERKLIKRTIHFEWNRAKVSDVDLPPVYQGSRVRIMVGVRGYRAYANLASAYKIKPSYLDSAAHMRTLLNPYGTRVPVFKLQYPSIAIDGLDPKRVLTTPLLTSPSVHGSKLVVK